jgi:hypothetical protein
MFKSEGLLKGNWKIGNILFTSLVILLLLFGLYPKPTTASQQTPPISLEVSEQEGQDPNSLVVVLTITANALVSNVILQLKIPEEVKSDTSRLPLQLESKKAVQLKFRLRTDKAGEHALSFEIKAVAAGYETAGTVERRYLVVDGKNPASLVTGKELRRLHREGVIKKINEQIRKDPNSGITLDTYLAGRLEAVPNPQEIKDRTPQALATPALGIEPYERAAIIDNTAKSLSDLDPLTVTGRVLFRDRSGSLQPFVNATIDVRDSDTGPDEQLTSVVSDWNGNFSAVVNNDDGWFQDGRDIYVRIRATNSRFRVQDCSYWPDWTYDWVTGTRDDLSDGTVVDFGSFWLVDYQEAAILFQDLNQGWNFLTTAGAQDPGFVDLCFPEGASQYSTFWEEVDIEDGDEVARDIVLHEYGHATMHNAYDGYWPSNTGGSHGFDDVLNPNFAFTEGWGTFIALSINDDGVYNSNGWSRNIESFNHSSGHSAGDGQQNEGHVAAGMGDVRDRNSDGNCTTGNCDPSGTNNAPMSAIWRDSFWGSKADNIADYWPKLCDVLNDAQRTAAVQALAFNDINLSNCVCTIELAVKDETDAPVILRDLREFRDLSLRNNPFGERIIALYNKYSAEASGIMLKNPRLIRQGAIMVRIAAEAHRVLKEPQKNDVLLTISNANRARQFISQLQEFSSQEFSQDLENVKTLLDKFQSLKADEIRAKLSEQGLNK